MVTTTRMRWAAAITGSAGVVTNASFAAVAGAAAAVVAHVAVTAIGDAVIFCTTDLMFVFTATARSHIPHVTCMLLLWEVTGGFVNVIRREVVMTGKSRWLGRWSATPAAHAALQAALSRQTGVDLWA